MKMNIQLDKPTKKRMKIMLICLAILFGAIVIYHLFTAMMIKHFMASQSKTVTVSAMKASYAEWQPQIKASGSLRAIKGVNVTTELAALVKNIYFQPGSLVNQGDVLVQLNSDSDVALLHSLQANEALAQIIYDRDKKQYAAEAISKATLDTDEGNLKSLKAQVAQQAAIVAKKTIRAPFTGRLGISAINLGQYLNAGDKVVSLQQLDPLYVDFYVPQQQLIQLKTGQDIEMTVDALPDKIFKGKITAMDPIVDATTRNIQIEGTIANPKFHLLPGMFSSVTVYTGAPERHLTLPQTAVTFNPYGDIVYVITQEGKAKKGKPAKQIVHQRFVTTGETRGDQITILEGLKEGDLVVTSGQLKLRNGSEVIIDNKVVPENDPHPDVSNED